jgi:hypothetical protein
MWFLFTESAGRPELRYNSLQDRRRVGHWGTGSLRQPLDSGQAFPGLLPPASFVQTAEIAQYEFVTIFENSVGRLLRFASRKVKPEDRSLSPRNIERIQNDRSS